MKRTNRLEILLTDEELERLEKIAKKLNKPKGRIARNLMLLALEDAELYNKLGFFDIAKAIEKLKEKAIKRGINLQRA